MFYTYSIKNIDTGKFYIGCRTAKCMLNRRPEDDLGIHYFSSTTDEELRQAIKDGRVEYHVLQEYDDANVCWKAEQQLIVLYWKFFGHDMSYNHSYINCKGEKVFSTAGMKHKPESIEKMKENRKGLTAGEKHPLYGIGHKPESIELMKRTKVNKSKEEKEAIHEKLRQTLLEKYGVENISQIPGVGEKISNSKKGKSHAPHSAETREKIGKSQKGKPKPKFYWRTPDGQTVIMDKKNALQWHPEWILIGPVEKYELNHE